MIATNPKRCDHRIEVRTDLASNLAFKTLVLVIILVGSILLCQSDVSLGITNIGKRDSIVSKPSEIILAIVMCDEDLQLNQKLSKRIGKKFGRQIDQALVLIKSLLVTTSLNDKLHISVVTNKEVHFKKLNNSIFENHEGDDWSTRFTSRLKLTFVPIEYPHGTEWMRNLFRPCATARLLFPDLLPYHDSVLYLDTDIIFLRNVNDLVSQFRYFGPNTLAGMAPCSGHYNTRKNKVPYYGDSGLNSGVVMMNLTRMRSNGWIQQVTMLATKYRSKLLFADQCILNIYFEANPDDLLLLDCDWNFRSTQCNGKGDICSKGISILHGSNISFTKNSYDPTFFTIFKTFSNTKLTTTFELKQVIQSLETNLARVKGNERSVCTNFPGFETMVSQSLRRNLPRDEL